MIEVHFFQDKYTWPREPRKERASRLFRGRRVWQAFAKHPDPENEDDHALVVFLDKEPIAWWSRHGERWIVQNRWCLERMIIRETSERKPLKPAPDAPCKRLFVPPPPRPLPPGPMPVAGPNLIEGGEPCDCEDGVMFGGHRLTIPGVFWSPDQPPCEKDIQPVERCDRCDRYESDEDAARVVADRYGLEAVFLEDRTWDIEKEDRHKGYGKCGVRPRRVAAPVKEI